MIGSNNQDLSKKLSLLLNDAEEEAALFGAHRRVLQFLGRRAKLGQQPSLLGRGQPTPGS